MNLIFLYGAPGVRKLTVGKELSKQTDYKLFHNHLTVDLVYSVFDFGTQPFIELREKIWLIVFKKAKEEKIKGMIFTFAPEDTVTSEFIPNLINLIEDDLNKIYFVKLSCSPDELRKRIVDPSRNRYVKAKSTEKIDDYYKRDYLIPSEVLKKTVVIDNTNLTAKLAAEKIKRDLDI